MTSDSRHHHDHDDPCVHECVCVCEREREEESHMYACKLHEVSCVMCIVMWLCYESERKYISDGVYRIHTCILDFDFAIFLASLASSMSSSGLNQSRK